MEIEFLISSKHKYIHRKRIGAILMVETVKRIQKYIILTKGKLENAHRKSFQKIIFLVKKQAIFQKVRNSANHV